MAYEIERQLDQTGWTLLQELQRDARQSYSELGQHVGLSSPAVAERMRKMEESGIIAGYHAEVNLALVGLPVSAIIRLGSLPGQSCTRIAASVSMIPEVMECYRVTGNDTVILKVVAASVDHLERIIDELSAYGMPTTSMVLSKPTKRQTLMHEMIERGREQEEIM